ncbi:DUF2785 domain-containing protein [Psychrobacillus sp. INOP01]|uniref:DUF2785 domain-containing protein n=1 Tax=Psychrobacillus sp. INOP01 TaxID=2829187 RepID=UPI001BA4EE19|nr:DUF2785 domain-containing protein [Psychrobacillus sp. INOP01]QUG42822.1 DUF2785 domain-containing protein [Psychrobacillus sp. INOP01]
MEAIELKKILSDIKSGERTWEDEQKVVIVNSMLEHIGSTDGELRDHLIYSLFYQLIVEKNLLEPELLTRLLEVALNDLLWKGIGEKGTDTVFTRSFTSLLIALILSRDNEDDFLDQNMILQVKDKLIDYMNLEKDLRGYVADKGWAHSIAHVADTFDELIKSKKVDEGLYGEILRALWNKIFVSNSVYIHEEEERILVPIMEVLERGLEIKEIEILLQQIPNELEKQKSLIGEEEYWFLYANCKRFLKSFLIEVQRKPNLYPIQKSLASCLQEI